VRPQQRPVVGRLDDRQLFEPLLDPLGNGMQDTGAFGARGRRPSGKRLTSSANSGIGLDRPAASDLTEALPVDGRDVGKGLTGGGGDTSTADPVPGVDGDTSAAAAFGVKASDSKGALPASTSLDSGGRL
jgi:hypothetical protein